MLPDSIGFDIAEMVKNAQQLIAATSALPPVGLVTENSGPTDAASASFRHELRWTADQLGLEVLKISKEIGALEGAIRDHQDSIVAQDDAVEGDMNQLLGFIDSSPAPSSTVSSPSDASGQTGTASGAVTLE